MTDDQGNPDQVAGDAVPVRPGPGPGPCPCTGSRTGSRPGVCDQTGNSTNRIIRHKTIRWVFMMSDSFPDVPKATISLGRFPAISTPFQWTFQGISW